MSDEIPEVEEPEVDQPVKPKGYSKENRRKLGFKHKMALLEILERKKFSDSVNYKAIAQRTGITPISLRKLYSQYMKGFVDLGEPQTVEEKRIDAKKQYEEARDIISRYQSLLQNGVQALLLSAEDESTETGDPTVYHRLGLPRAMRELRAALEMRTFIDKGYDAAMDEIRALEKNPIRMIEAPMSDETKTRIIGMTEEQRIMEALRARKVQTVEADMQVETIET